MMSTIHIHVTLNKVYTSLETFMKTIKQCIALFQMTLNTGNDALSQTEGYLKLIFSQNIKA